MTWRLDETLQPEDRVPSHIGETLKNFLTLIKDRQFAGYTLTLRFHFGGHFRLCIRYAFRVSEHLRCIPAIIESVIQYERNWYHVGTSVVGRFADTVSETPF